MSEQAPQSRIEDIKLARDIAFAIDAKMTRAQLLSAYSKKLSQDPDGIHHYYIYDGRDGLQTVPLNSRPAPEELPEAYGREQDRSTKENTSTLNQGFTPDDLIRRKSLLAEDVSYWDIDKYSPVAVPNKAISEELEGVIARYHRYASDTAIDIQTDHEVHIEVKQFEDEHLDTLSNYTSNPYPDLDSSIYEKWSVAEVAKSRKQLIATVLEALEISKSPEELTQEQRQQLIMSFENHAYERFGKDFEMDSDANYDPGSLRPSF